MTQGLRRRPTESRCVVPSFTTASRWPFLAMRKGRALRTDGRDRGGRTGHCALGRRGGGGGAGVERCCGVYACPVYLPVPHSPTLLSNPIRSREPGAGGREPGGKAKRSPKPEARSPIDARRPIEARCRMPDADARSMPKTRSPIDAQSAKPDCDARSSKPEAVQRANDQQRNVRCWQSRLRGGAGIRSTSHPRPGPIAHPFPSRTPSRPSHLFPLPPQPHHPLRHAPPRPRLPNQAHALRQRKHLPQTRRARKHRDCASH